MEKRDLSSLVRSQLESYAEGVTDGLEMAIELVKDAKTVEQATQLLKAILISGEHMERVL